MDLNINGGHNTIAPNATKVEQHVHITISVPCSTLTVIGHLIVCALEWWCIWV